MDPYRLHRPMHYTVPLFLDSPHSGTHYPDDFVYRCPQHVLRQTEDMFVAQLFESAPELGIGLLEASHTRAYIDLNRARDDINPLLVKGSLPFTLNPTERSFAGHGLIRDICRGQAVYGAPLTVEHILGRITKVYDPYHDILATMLMDIRAQCGAVYHINCHSMPSQGLWATMPRARTASADIVLGDRDGAACDPGLVYELTRLFRNYGYRVVHNDPYKGVEMVRRWGRPKEGFHCVQLEMSRHLYMDEETLVPNDRFTKTKSDLAAILRQLRTWVAARHQKNGEKLAAE